MSGSKLIQVLLPLRLEWEPFYSYSDDSTPSPLLEGDRVRVEFAGKEYVGTVTVSDASAEAAGIGLERIKPISGLAEGLDRISHEEISLWRQVADYYLCTPGEVYKAAYPAGKVEEEGVKSRIKERLQHRIEKLDEKIAKARREETRERYVAEREELMRQVAGPSAPLRGQKEEILRSAQNDRTSTELNDRTSTELNDRTGTAAGSGLSGINLSAAQQEAYSKIKEVLKAGKPALLRGVTGSGKTEIYLKLAAETLAGGKNVIYLVPEIALSRQLEERIRNHFPNELQVFHSGMTVAKRAESAAFIKTSPYIALGTRSSLFLPHRNIGLIIVDEENDPSYKQDNPAPRYNGRETAIMLAGIHGADIILGSATPSLESLYNCQVGRFGLIDLTTRYFQASDSDVEIIDTIAERKKNGMIGSFSRKLIERIRECLAKGGQVAILRERRSYSPMLQCDGCGHIPKCSRCDVALSLHLREDGQGSLVCHYCGKVYEYTGRCPECGGELKLLGAGTQKIEEEAATLFPGARIARLDSDSARSGKHESEIIRGFAAGEIDILVGTRIVAKGFDFSGLSLVAVLRSDSLLAQQDYRADERAMHLLEQFRGRCGRRAEKGLFVVQTSQPDHPVYKSLTGAQEASTVTDRLLKERKLFGYPPYSRVINTILRDRNIQRIGLMGRSLSSLLAGTLGIGAKVIGPYSPAVDKTAGENIRIIRVMLPKDKNLRSCKSALQETVERFSRDRKYIGHISLDVDPV